MFTITRVLVIALVLLLHATNVSAATFVPGPGNIRLVVGRLDAERPSGHECVSWTLYGRYKGQSSRTFTSVNWDIKSEPETAGVFNPKNGSYCFLAPSGNFAVKLTLTVDGKVGEFTALVVAPAEARFESAPQRPAPALLCREGSIVEFATWLPAEDGRVVLGFEYLQLEEGSYDLLLADISGTHLVPNAFRVE